MVEFIPAREMKRVPEPVVDERIAKVVSAHAKRLGVDEDVALDNAMKFAETVGILENDGRTKGGNVPQEGKEASSAKGLYQYITGSIEPAMNRLEKYIGEEEWMTAAREEKDANLLDRDQQTLMFLADILEKKGSDKYMKDVLTDANDTEAVKQAYYTLHHTAPDEATMKRTERILNGA